MYTVSSLISMQYYKTYFSFWDDVEGVAARPLPDDVLAVAEAQLVERVGELQLRLLGQVLERRDTVENNWHSCSN